jgi:hypothetical protein
LSGALGAGPRVDAANLPAGTHVITLTATDAHGQTGTATVTITVVANPAPPGPILAVGPRTLAFELSVSDGGDPDPQLLRLRNDGTVEALSWTAASNQPWLILSSTAGTTPMDLTVSVNAAGLALGVTHQAQITITAPGAGGSPIVVNVTAGGEQPLSALNGTVVLQGRTLNTLAYQVPLQVSLFQPGTTTVVAEGGATTSQTGTFTVTELPSGTYDVQIKLANGLTRTVPGVVLPAGGAGTANFGTVLVGDADNNNRVTAADFTALKQTFLLQTGCATQSPIPNPCADFDGNGTISPNDFSLLKVNFLQQGT